MKYTSDNYFIKYLMKRKLWFVMKYALTIMGKII